MFLFKLFDNSYPLNFTRRKRLNDLGNEYNIARVYALLKIIHPFQ